MKIFVEFNDNINDIQGSGKHYWSLVYSGYGKWHTMFLGWGSQRFKKDVCQKYDFIVMFYESNYFVMVVIRNGSPFSLSAHSPDFTFFMDWQQGSLTGLLFYSTWCDHLLQYHKKKNRVNCEEKTECLMTWLDCLMIYRNLLCVFWPSDTAVKLLTQKACF